MSNQQELCYGWDVFEKFIICIAWYLKTLRLNGCSAWLPVSTVPIYCGMLHLCSVPHLKERKDHSWMSRDSLCFKNAGSWCSVWLLMDTLPVRSAEGYFNDLNADGIQSRDVSVRRLRKPGSRVLGCKCITESGVNLLRILFNIWWYLRVEWVFTLCNPPNSWSFWFMAEWEMSRGGWAVCA